LAAGLRSQLGHDVVGADGDESLTEQRLQRAAGLGLVHLGHDVRATVADGGPHREQHLHRVRVVAVTVADHHHGARAREVHHLEVARHPRLAAAADHAGRPHVRDGSSQRLLHLGLVGARQDHDRGPLAALVGDHQLAHDRRHPRRPAEDERVVVLDHVAPTPAQLVDPLIEAARDQTDQAAGDEDAAERDEQAEQAGAPARVGREGARVDDAQHRLPQRLRERQRAAPR
jgi:hypothetical protein